MDPGANAYTDEVLRSSGSEGRRFAVENVVAFGGSTADPGRPEFGGVGADEFDSGRYGDEGTRG